MYTHGVDWRRIHELLSRFPFSGVLVGASLLYGLATMVRMGFYKHGIINQRSLPGFVLSVGNITTGGTGKTPAVMMLAQWAKQEGYSVCVLSRGYGGKYSQKVVEVSDGVKIKVPWEQCGDEPYLLASRLKGVPVVVSKRRYSGGSYAAKRFESNFFILDDGFQHIQLVKDFDLVLMDSKNPFGNGHLLPWGLLREPRGAIGRAHAIIFTGGEYGSGGVDRLELIESFGISYFSGCHLPEAFFIPAIGAKYEPGFLAGKKVVAFAGIGRPESFEKTLRDLRANIIVYKVFPDHYVYEKGEVQGMEQMAKDCGADYLITTEKDWIRIRDLAQDKDRLGYLSIKFELKGQSDEFFGLIKEAARRKLYGNG